MASVAENIKRLRKDKGWTQVKLSLEAHVSQQAISFIESGRNEPSADMIRALSAALGVSSSDIIGDESPRVNVSGLSKNEIKLLKIYNQLNESGKTMLIAQAEIILQQLPLRKKDITRSVV